VGIPEVVENNLNIFLEDILDFHDDIKFISQSVTLTKDGDDWLTISVFYVAGSTT